MNARALRMLFGAVALSAIAAVLAGGANARPAEGAGVPAEIYSASTSPVVNEHQTPQSGTFLVDPEIYSAFTSPTVLSEQRDAQTELLQQTSVRERLGEIGAWAVPSLLQKPQLLQQTSVRERLGEIGAWAVPSLLQKPQLLQQTSVRERLGEIGAWAVPSISQQTPLATNPTVVPDVDPSTFEGYRG